MQSTADFLFAMIYGRQATTEESAWIRDIGAIGRPSMTQAIRAIIGSIDRQTVATPFLVRFGPEDVRMASVNGIEMALDSADFAVSYLLDRDQGHYEGHLTNYFRQNLKAGMTVVDVGANIGYYSTLASDLVGREGRVISFEPNSENCRLILITLEHNKISNIQLIPMALSSKTGAALFSPFIGSNGGMLTGAAATIANSQCIVVPTVRMDDVVQGKVDFIKVDTEGAEGMVLAGASAIINKYRPIISSEFSPEMLSRVSQVVPSEYLKSMQARGYKIILLGRTKGNDEEALVDDVDEFLRDYNLTRIEDLIFYPQGL